MRFIQETPADELVKKHLDKVFKAYHSQFGEVCTGCPTKIAGYINRLKKLQKSNIMEKDKREFRLKEGAVIMVPGTSEVYSNGNLTDEVAIRFIKKNPNRKQLFAKLPSNVDKLLEGKEEEATHVKVGDRQFTVEEGVSILGQIGVNTSAKTIEGVQKRFDGLKAGEKKKLDELFGVANTLTEPGTSVNPPADNPEEVEVNNPEMPDEEE
jgi:hypothetical protein